MLTAVFLLSLFGQCQPGQACYRPGYQPAFAAQPMQVRGDRAIIHPTLGRQTARNAWTDTAGNVHYSEADNPHLAATPVGAGPSLSALADELHKLKTTVDDLTSLKRVVGEVAPAPKLDTCPKCKDCAVCPNTGGPCTCKDCHCDILEKKPALPSIPESLPPIFGAVTETGQPTTAETHPPVSTCDEECKSYGVDHEALIPKGQKSITSNVNPTPATQAFAGAMVEVLNAKDGSIGAERSSLPDDSAKHFLTVYGDKPACDAVKSDLDADGELKDEAKGLHVNFIDPNDKLSAWKADRAKIPATWRDGNPLVILSDRAGNVFWHGKGHPERGRLLSHIRKAKAGIIDAIWMAWLEEHLGFEIGFNEILAVVVILAFIVLLPRKKPAA
jgi:hypothetical protein